MKKTIEPPNGRAFCPRCSALLNREVLLDSEWPFCIENQGKGPYLSCDTEADTDYAEVSIVAHKCSNPHCTYAFTTRTDKREALARLNRLRKQIDKLPLVPEELTPEEGMDL